MLNKTYSLRPHCVSCWTTYILPQSVGEVVRSIIGDNLIQLLTEHLTFTIVKMHKNGKFRQKHLSGPISHLKK